MKRKRKAYLGRLKDMRISKFSDVKASSQYLKRVLIDEKAYGIQCKAIGKAINNMNKILVMFEKICDENDLEIKTRRKNF